MTEILILGEQANGDLNSLCKELLAAADSISETFQLHSWEMIIDLSLKMLSGTVLQKSISYKAN